MNKFFLAPALLCLTLAGCANKTPHSNFGTKFVQAYPAHFKPTNAVCVKRLEKSSLNQHYTVLGKAYVSKLSFYGIQRQKATVNWLLDQQAAKMGGQALTNIHEDKTRVVATVIRFNYPGTAKTSKS